ncbi:MAG: methyltransferase domain-containing protein [Planctomycetes bacterium]|nr:methyltransferase domain-containing protein [Planctomycetota bacterium]
MAATSPASDPTSAPPAPGPLFLRKFLRDPGGIASVWPSSRHLARAMLAGIRLQPGDAVVELGPGTGPFTERIRGLLDAVPGSAYLGVDLDEEFVALLRRRHPDIEFVVADAGNLDQLLADRPRLRPAAFVSGLPLVSMDREVVQRLLRTVHSALPPGGVFRTFSYAHTVLNPASWWLRNLLRARFTEFRVRGPIWRNVPPALVFDATK